MRNLRRYVACRNVHWTPHDKILLLCNVEATRTSPDRIYSIAFGGRGLGCLIVNSWRFVRHYFTKKQLCFKKNVAFYDFHFNAIIYETHRGCYMTAQWDKYHVTLIYKDGVHLTGITKD